MRLTALLLLVGVCTLTWAKRVDKCGCVWPKGWSMKYKKCMRGSVTDIHDDCIDRCGCKYPEGWSSTSKKCKKGSTTDDHEKCSGGGGFYCNPKAPCPSHWVHRPHGNAACLIKDNGKVYMNVMTAYDGKQNENKYDLPGGTDDKPGGESQECVAYRETCEEAGFKVNIGKKLNHWVFECTIVPGTNKVPKTNAPWEVKYGKWLPFSEAKRAGKTRYRNNGRSWGGFWNLVKNLR